MVRSLLAALFTSMLLGACATNADLRIRTEAAQPGSFDSRSAREIEIDINTLLDAALCPPAADQAATPARAPTIRTTRVLPNGTLEVKVTEHEQEPAPNNGADACSPRWNGSPADRYLRLSELLRDHAENRSIRNQVVTQLIGASSTNCSAYLLSLRGAQVGARLSSDIASTTTGLAGTLTDHLPTAQVWAALSAWSTSAGASIDRTIFAQQGIELVAEQIERIREQRRQEIEDKLNSTYDDYPIGLALADIALFHSDCSLMRGFSAMQEAVRSREDAIRLARITAMRVSDEDGSGRQVAAAISGVADVYLGLDRYEDPSTTVVARTFRSAPDVAARRTRAVELIVDPVSAATIDTRLEAINRAIGHAGELCAPIAPPLNWNHRLLVSARNSLCGTKTRASETPSQATEIFARARADALREIEREADEIIEARVAAGESLRALARVGATATSVESRLTALSASEEIARDPFFAILSAAAASVSSQSNGPLSANVALAAGGAYLETYNEQNDPGLR